MKLHLKMDENETDKPKERYISPEILLKNYDQYNNIIMEYQKIIYLLENTPNQPSNFRQKIGLK